MLARCLCVSAFHAAAVSVCSAVDWGLDSHCPRLGTAINLTEHAATAARVYMFRLPCLMPPLKSLGAASLQGPR